MVGHFTHQNQVRSVRDSRIASIYVAAQAVHDLQKLDMQAAPAEQEQAVHHVQQAEKALGKLRAGRRAAATDGLTAMV